MSLIVRKMWIKTTKRHNLTLTRTDIIRKSKNNIAAEGMKKREFSYTTGEWKSWFKTQQSQN